MTNYQIVTIVMAVIALITAMVGLYAVIRNYAIDSMGEIRYMIKCAKERRRIIPDDQVELIRAEDELIKSLENKLETFWGRKLAGKNKSTFDIIPTPKEDPDGKLIKRILRG